MSLTVFKVSLALSLLVLGMMVCLMFGMVWMIIQSWYCKVWLGGYLMGVIMSVISTVRNRPIMLRIRLTFHSLMVSFWGRIFNYVPLFLPLQAVLWVRSLSLHKVLFHIDRVQDLCSLTSEIIHK